MQPECLKNPAEAFFPHNSDSVIFGYSVRQDGNMSLNYGDTALSLSNRQRFLGRLGLDYQALVCAKQAHTSNIRIISTADKGKGARHYGDALDNTDGLITIHREIPLAIFTADCLGIGFYAPNRKVAGLVHAGWKGTRGRVAAEAVRLFQEEFSVKPYELYVFIAAGIRGCCYQVGVEMKEYFPGWVEARGEKFYLDLSRINRAQLLESAVEEGNIYDCGICTSCDKDRYFSYRNEGASCGRMMTVIMLR
jgi:YfiH family protein